MYRPTSQTCHRFSFTECDGAVDVVFIVDSSGSIRSSRYPLVLDYVKGIVKSLEVHPDRARVGLITFGDEATVRFHLNTYATKEDVLQAIDNLPWTRGRTNTADAIHKVRTEMFTSSNGDRFDPPNMAVIITDGQSNVNEEDTLPEAMEARLEGIHMMAVAVGTSQTSLEIKGLASDPDSVNVFRVEEFGELVNMTLPVVDAMCDGKLTGLALSSA